jgi:hypothetical protein
MFFSVYGGIMALFGAGYYHFAFGVEKTKRELAEAKEKIASLEKHSGTTANDAVKAA